MLINRLLLIAALACLAVPTIAQNATSSNKLHTAGALFGMRETVQQIDISPDGNQVVYVTPGPGRTSIAYVANLAADSEPQLAYWSNGSPDRLNWCKFASNDRLVCQVHGEVETAGVLVPFSRLIAINTDGKNIRMLGQRGSQYDTRLRQFDGDILDWLPDDNGAVLMARDYIPEAKAGTRLARTENGIGIDRIDVTTLTTTRVEDPMKAADFFISDGRGNVRIKAFRPDRGGTGQLASRIDYHYRLPGSKEWKFFSSWNGSDGIMPIEIDASTNSAYALKTLDGRLALYRVKLDGSMATDLVYKNTKVDVDGVVRVGRGSRVIGVTFAEEKRHVIYFDPEYAELATALDKAIPNLPMIDFLGSSADNNDLLIRAGSDSDPGRYYVYDRTKRALKEILLERPALEEIRLARVKPITYPASDGTPIPAYLTLPAGNENAHGLPAVMLPHGGPSARDEWGFDWLAQYLAHQGYAVLQPNYRGSAGYGDAWLHENGFKNWRTSIGDVTAGAEWLVKQGIADPAKLAIVGWSYGGYAALQSGVTEPDLFKAIVAIAPVTDLNLVKLEARDYTNARNVADQIGSGTHIVEGSPLQNIQRIKAPVIMFHGTMDLNVGVQQSRKMDSKLRSAGKASELILYDGLDHSLADSDARAQMLDRIGIFLKANIGD